MKYYKEKEDCKRKGGLCRIEILFVGNFEEVFELDDFPFDAQFLNIQLKLKPHRYAFKTWVGRDGEENAKQFLSGIEERRLNDWHHHRPISVVIHQPADKEWTLLKPWMDFRINNNTFFCIIRLRVKRKAGGYIWNNIVPLVGITGLSFIYIAIEEQIDRLTFIVALLLTIAAGRSELVPQMPSYAGPNKIDYFVLFAYVIFAVEMIYVASVGHGDNGFCGIYNWDEHDDGYCVAEMIIFIICVLVWLGGICYIFHNTIRGFVFWEKTEELNEISEEEEQELAGLKSIRENKRITRCCCGDGNFWKKRSNKEYKSWEAEQIVKGHVTVDPKHYWGSDKNKIERGQELFVFDKN